MCLFRTVTSNSQARNRAVIRVNIWDTVNKEKINVNINTFLQLQWTTHWIDCKTTEFYTYTDASLTLVLSGMGSEKTSETLCQKNLARKMATRRKRQIVLPALGRAAVAVGVDLQNQRHWRRRLSWSRRRSVLPSQPTVRHPSGWQEKHCKIKYYLLTTKNIQSIKHKSVF